MTATSPSQPAGTPCRVLQLGGSSGHFGGLESFCERSRLALEQRGGFAIESMETQSAHLSLRRLPTFLRALRRMLKSRRDEIDCAWVQYASLPDLAYAVVARMVGMRVMLTPHLGTQWRSQSNPFLRRMSDLALRSAHRLALISATQENDLRLPRGVPRSFIRNFLPQELLEGAFPILPPPDRPLLLIHSGRLSAGKGSFLFIDLCARLRDLGIPFEARITGGADEETLIQIRESIAGYGLDDKVRLLGRVPEEDLLELLRSADLLVHLSRIDSYPLIVLEALASGVIPICMELAGARDMVESYDGHVVSMARPVEEAATWIAAQDVADLRARALKSAADVRADYAWPRCAAALAAALIACATGDPKDTALPPSQPIIIEPPVKSV